MWLLELLVVKPVT